MKLTEYPLPGELVIVKIKRITLDGAIAELQEYTGKEGFVHRSNVASSWVKNIRNFLSEGEIKVASVINIDRSRKTIDLSLRRVSDSEAKTKLEDSKREKRADKLFERFCNENKMDFKKTYSAVSAKLADEFGDFLSAFENAAIYGAEPFKTVPLEPQFLELFIAFSKNNIEPPEAVVKGDLELFSFKENGFSDIKNALLKAESPDIKIEYLSAPVYRIEAKAIDFEKAEKKMSEAAHKIINEVEKAGGTGTFKRIKDK